MPISRVPAQIFPISIPLPLHCGSFAAKSSMKTTNKLKNAHSPFHGAERTISVADADRSRVYSILYGRRIFKREKKEPFHQIFYHTRHSPKWVVRKLRFQKIMLWLSCRWRCIRAVCGAHRLRFCSSLAYLFWAAFVPRYGSSCILRPRTVLMDQSTSNCVLI